MRTAHNYDVLFRSFGSAHSELWDFSYLHQIVVGEISVDLNTALQSRLTEIDALDIQARTPLHWAALRGDSQSLETLLLAGANAHLQDKEGRSGLHSALQSGNVKCVKMLLMAGSSIDAKDNYGDRAIQIATWANDNPEILELLFLAGASHSVTNAHEVTALQSAACLNHYRNGTFLLDVGADMNSKDHDDDTPLLEALRFGSPDMLNLLLDRGADVLHVNKSGHSILHIATIFGNLTCVELLRQRGLRNLNAQLRDRAGRTPRDALSKRVAIDSELYAALTCLLDEVDNATRGYHDEDDHEDEDFFVDANE